MEGRRTLTPVGKMIQAYIAEHGLTRATLASSIGTDRQSLENFMYGETKQPRFVFSLAAKMQVDPGDLVAVASRKPPRAGRSGTTTSAITHIRRVAPTDIVAVPRFAVNGSMGLGQLQPDRDTIVGELPLNRFWAAENLRGVTKLENLALITGMGDSMEPTFRDGDLLLVDRGVTEVKADTVYVLALNDELYVKRLQRDPRTGGVLMLSDNKLNEPIPIGPDEMDRFRILGRVVWAWNGRKL